MAFEVSREEIEKLFKIVKTRIYVYILGDLGAFSGAGRKGATKVSNHGRKSPWVLTLTGPFPNGRANAGSRLGTKIALCYCAQSANSFF